MIDVDSMQQYIRAANPVPSPDLVDPDELARFAAMADAVPMVRDHLETGPFRRSPTQRRGPVVAVATAALVFSLVAIAVVSASLFGDGEVPADDGSPVATGQTRVTSAVPNPALLSKHLIPHPSENPAPISTSIGEIEFEMLEFESAAYSLHYVEWTSHGLVAANEDRLYWSNDYYNWQSIPTSVPAGSVTVVDDDVVVHGVGGTVRYGWDGTAWSEVATIDMVDVERFAFGPTGAVAVAGGELWYSTDGLSFDQAAVSPSSGSVGASQQGRCPYHQFGPLDMGPPLLVTDTGFVTLASSVPGRMDEHPICAPVLWSSSDGSSWVLVSAESPFGESSAVYEVAERAGRFVATGATDDTPAVIWVSDDGLAWERIDLELGNIDGIAAGGLGWVITGSDLGSGRETWGQTMLFSPDGRSWDGPYDRPDPLLSGYLPPQMAVGDDVIFGIGNNSDVLIVRLQG